MKDRIEIGEYVRNESGYIHKIDSIDKLTNFYIDEENNIREWEGETVLGDVISEKIVKHSKNIIDLIEVGDVIEVYKDISKYEVIGKNGKYIETLEDRYVVIEDIKSILTKEQFKQNCYEVKEN